MSMSISRRQFAISSVVSFFGWTTIGCGTILHPERKGQPAGDLDWSVVALDGVGLLLFLVPGVIAFAVDFNNGSIYLPAEEKPQTASRRSSKRKLTAVPTRSPQLTHGGVEHAIAQHTGKHIRLIHGEYETHQLENIEQFWAKHDQLHPEVT